MADSQTPPEASSQRGGRRRGRGGAAPPGRGESTPNTDGEKRSKPRTRGSGRGGGDTGRQNRNTDQKSNKDTQPKSTVTSTKKPVEAATDDADDGEVCFICASTVEHTSVSPCNHRTCHICALRLRALYKNKACAHCRVWSPCRLFYGCRISPTRLAGWDLHADNLSRPNQISLSSQTIQYGGMKTSRRMTSLERTRTWGSNMRMT